MSLNERVVNVLKNNMWDIATCAYNQPNVVTVAFKDVTEDGKLLVGDVFLDTTLRNIEANSGRVAVTAFDAQTFEGMFNGTATAKGALVITPEKVIVTTPGADNKKEL